MNKLKGIEQGEKIVYLKDGINKFLKIYPKSFNKRSIDLLEVLARNESIDTKMCLTKLNLS